MLIPGIQTFLAKCVILYKISYCIPHSVPHQRNLPNSINRIKNIGCIKIRPAERSFPLLTAHKTSLAQVLNYQFLRVNSLLPSKPILKSPRLNRNQLNNTIIQFHLQHIEPQPYVSKQFLFIERPQLTHINQFTLASDIISFT